MIDKKAWSEFRTSGMLWFVNTILHAFGWAIVLIGYLNFTGFSSLILIAIL